ncbi:MAG: hypothetical protein KC964_31550, partial [Candidatus Omnitrophica bacterium]|nr:hypothetical protein [Candidatus Omnitrophota bacterium]
MRLGSVIILINLIFCGVSWSYRQVSLTIPGEVVIRSNKDLDLGIVKSKTTVFAKILPLNPSNRTTKSKLGKAPPSRGKLYLLRGDRSLSSEELVKEAKRIPGVYQAEANYQGNLSYAPSDPQYAQTADHLGCVGFEEAWDVQTGDPSVLVAVID